MKMQISLDGGVTYQPVEAESVRVVYDDVEYDTNDVVELHVVLTPEGCVFDVVSSDDGEDIIGTQSETVVEIVERLTENRS